MATLTSNITSSAVQIDVTGDVSGAQTRAEYRIDDEIVVLRKFVRELFGVPNPWGQLNRNKWIVSRGQAGTMVASHLAGAEIVGIEDAVTTGTTLTLPEPFVDATGGVQTVRLLGPFHIAFDSPGLSGTGDPAAALGEGGYAAITPLPDGALVVDEFVVPTVAWAGGADNIKIVVQPVDDPDNSDDLGSWGLAIGNEPGVYWRSSRIAMSSSASALVIAGAELACYLGGGGGIATAGEADIYALIAEPA